MLNDNPSSATAWKSQVRRVLKVQPQTVALFNLAKANSASKLTQKEFLHLKVLWAELKPAKVFSLETFVDQESIEIARQRIGTAPCKAFCQTGTTNNETSIFSLPALYLKLVTNLEAENDAESSKVLISPRRTRSMTAAQPATPSTPTGLFRNLNLDPETPPSGAAETPGIEVSGSDATGLSLEYLSPANPSEFAATEDEAIVNMALALLLNALTEVPPLEIGKQKYQWLPNREVFKILCPGLGKTERLLEARTDGCLRHLTPRGEKLPAAIVEVKPYLRQGPKQIALEWQESAQMASFIEALLKKQHASSKFGLLKSDASGALKRRLLVSQDHKEVYIIIGEYDVTYEAYLRGEAVAQTAPGASKIPKGDTAMGATSGRPKGFLVMHCYGPWDTRNSDHLKDLCFNLAALTSYLSKMKATEPRSV